MKEGKNNIKKYQKNNIFIYMIKYIVGIILLLVLDVYAGLKDMIGLMT